jgi:hypothetical protein
MVAWWVELTVCALAALTVAEKVDSTVVARVVVTVDTRVDLKGEQKVASRVESTADSMDLLKAGATAWMTAVEMAASMDVHSAEQKDSTKAGSMVESLADWMVEHLAATKDFQSADATVVLRVALTVGCSDMS